MQYPQPRLSRFSVKVRRSSAGLGLYAAQEIPRGRFVIEYYGPLVDDDTANRVGGKYLFDLENGKTILGAHRANVARYANHSCRPNAEVRTAKSRVFIHALKRIRPGEEITYDYGEEYFTAYIGKRRCRCTACARRRAATRGKSR